MARGPKRVTRGHLDHPAKVQVIDGRKKIWFLILLHEWLHQEHQRAHSHNAANDPNKASSVFDGQDEKHVWYEKSLFDAGKLIPFLDNIRSPSSDKIEALTRKNLVSIFHATCELTDSTLILLYAIAEKTQFNRRFGYDLDAAGRWSNRNNTSAAFLAIFFPDGVVLDSLKEGETLATQARRTSPDHFSTRVLYRMVRAFFMVPMGDVPSLETANMKAYCDKHLPSHWNFYLDTGHLDMSKHRPLAPQEQQIWDKSQAAAAKVAQMFCVHLADSKMVKDRNLAGQAYGGSIEEFINAASAYYLSDETDIIFCKLLDFYEEHRSTQQDQTAASFTSTQYSVEGDAESVFGAALWANLSDTLVKISGSFVPPVSKDPVEFKILDVVISKDGDAPVKLAGLNPMIEKYPPGVAPVTTKTGKAYGFRIQKDGTQGLNAVLADGVPTLRMTHERKAFELSYRVTAPLCSIGDPPQGHNGQTSTFNQVVLDYLKSALSITQQNWTPPPTVEIIPLGVFRFEDAPGGGAQ